VYVFYIFFMIDGVLTMSLHYHNWMNTI